MNDNIVIAGIGIISTLGTDLAAIRNNLHKKMSVRFDSEIPFVTPLPSSKLRRISRYSKLALYTALSAQSDAGITILEKDSNRFGTVFTTGYGAVVSNIKFGKSTSIGDPDLCSPMIFAETVPNCCVGQVCMHLNLKGASTFLFGGNALFYSTHLIKSGKADTIFSGAVEEYSEDLFSSLKANDYAKNIDIQEASVVFALQKEKEAKNNPYCTILSSASAGLSGYPLIKRVEYLKSKIVIEHTIKRCINGLMPDSVYGSANGSYFDEIEQNVIDELFPNIKVVQNVKKYFGETMGSSFAINIAVAAMSFEDSNNKNILVTGYDPLGNYLCVMLGKTEADNGIA